jgi:hypothetical protein
VWVNKNGKTDFVWVVLLGRTTVKLYTLFYTLNTLYIMNSAVFYVVKKNVNSVAVVRKQTILTEWPPLVGEVSVNLCG